MTTMQNPAPLVEAEAIAPPTPCPVTVETFVVLYPIQHKHPLISSLTFNVHEDCSPAQARRRAEEFAAAQPGAVILHYAGGAR